MHIYVDVYEKNDYQMFRVNMNVFLPPLGVTLWLFLKADLLNHLLSIRLSEIRCLHNLKLVIV